MNCDEARKLMHGFADRELGLESSLRLEAHLEGCGACSSLLADLEATRRSAAAAMAYHPAPPGLEAGIRTRLRGGTSAPRTRRTALLAAPLFAIALAIGWLGGRHFAALDAATAATSERVVFHISAADNARSALRNLANHLDSAPGVQVVVVAHNTGVDFLLAGARDREGVAYQPAVAELKRRGVDFRACGNTLALRGIGPGKVIPEAALVRSGIAEISRLQTREGYAYLRL
jgi:intracellular sulfur oxidation DsrE/DsrF family protein